jgi:hypothetical protein
MATDPVIESHRRYNASYRRNKEIAVKWWRDFLKIRNVTVKPSTYFASVELWTPLTSMDEIRKQVLARLTPEERMALGYG